MGIKRIGMRWLRWMMGIKRIEKMRTEGIRARAGVANIQVGEWGTRDGDG